MAEMDTTSLQYYLMTRLPHAESSLRRDLDEMKWEGSEDYFADAALRALAHEEAAKEAVLRHPGNARVAEYARRIDLLCVLVYNHTGATVH